MKKFMVLTAATALMAACGSGGTDPILPPPPPPPQPQVLTWNNYCTNGTPQFCGSVELTLLPDTLGHTAVTVRMRNLEGSLGTVPWRMQNVSFSDLLSTDSLLGSPFYPKQARLLGTSDFHVEIDSTFCANSTTPPSSCPRSNWGQTEWYTYRSQVAGRGGFYWTIEGLGPMMPSIVGCAVPANAPSNFSTSWGAFQTCGNGWVEVSFTLKGSWMFDAASTMTWYAYSDQGDAACHAGVNCAQSAGGAMPSRVALRARN